MLAKWKRWWRKRVRAAVRRDVVDLFHETYYHRRDTWSCNTFLGVPIQQCPLDLQIYQELVVRDRPDFVLQTGVAAGGSLLYFATLLDLTGAPAEAPVVGIDITLSDSVRAIRHQRIHLIEGDSTDPAVVEQAKQATPPGRGLIILDSDHTRQHVLTELHCYADLSSIGSHLVVEDTNINGHPVAGDFGPGPAEAVAEFLESDRRFERDDALWQRQLFSFHQGGWLHRVR